FAQSYSNLSRYKSFLKDKQKNIYYDFNGEYLNDREIGFGSEVKQRIKNGSEILNKENYKSRYIKETEIIDILKLKTKKIFKEYDFLITPTAPKAAIKINYMTNSSAKQLDIFTVFANLTEIPALSIPLNNSVAMQIMAEKMSDEKIFNFIQNV
ncbi:MAG: amidase family protein, partial [Clostridia bacterium]